MFPSLSLHPQNMKMASRFITIVEGSVKLFRKYGLRSISMDSIASSLGISKKTLYQYVDSKEDLIRKVCQYVIDKNPAREIQENANLNAIEVLLEISRLTRAETVELNPIVVHDLQKFYPNLYNDIYIMKRDMVCNDVTRNVERGIKDGLYREGIEIELLSKLFVKNLMEIEDPEFLNASSDKIFFIMIDTLIRALVNRKGLEYYENNINPRQFN